MHLLWPEAAVRYATSLLFVAAAWGIGEWLTPTNRWLIFFPVVVASGCLGGLGPALLSGILAACGLVITGAAPHWGGPGELARIVVLVGTGVLAGAWRQHLYHTRQQLEMHTLTCQQTQVALALSEQRFHAIFDQAAVGICLATLEGEMKLVNQKLCQMLGYSREELLTRTYQEITYPDDWPAQVVQAGRLKAGETNSYSMEKRYIRKDGSIIWASLTCSALRGERDYVVAIIEDISERKRAEEASRQARARYSALFDRSLDCVYLIGFDGRFIDANPAALELMGYTREEIPSLDMTKVVDSSCLGLALSRMDELRRNGHIAKAAEFKAYRKDGRPVYLEAKGAVIYEEGKPVAIQGIARDITDRKQAEEALRESEEKFRTLAETMHASVGVVQDTHFVYANHYMSQMLGYSVEEILAMDFPQLIHPTQRARMIDYARRRQLGEEVPGHYEFIAITKTGEHRWVDFAASRTLYQGRPAIIGTGFDITGRKRVEERLRAHTRSLNLLAGAATRLLATDHLDSALHEIYEELAAHLGANAYWEYRLSDDGAELHLHDYRGLPSAISQRLAQVRMGQTLCATAARDKQRVIAEVVQQSSEPQLELMRGMGVRAYACHPLLFNQVLIGTLSFCVSDRDRFSEEELELMRAISHQVAMALEHERLAAQLKRHAAELTEANRAKDHFLATLSHELRTPLTPVIASLSALEDEKEVPPVVREELGMIQRNVELEARLIDDLLDLTRVARGKITLNRKPTSLCAILEHVAQICAADIDARGISFGMHLEDSTITINGDPTRLEQIFWNLLKNAIKFTPHGGQILVRVWREGEMGLAEVSDTGQGIAPELLPRIFDAFEQGSGDVTRRFGGLGLGLAICKAMVELHGGSISASSDGVGRGARFTVRLPAVSQAAASPPESAGRATKDRPNHRPLHVLLVEDHGDTARVLKRALRAFGHEVETAGDVATALQTAKTRSIDVLVSDLGLPDRSGLDLIQELRAAGYRMPAVAMSGYGQEEDLQRSRAAGYGEHLVKPVDVHHLQEAIERAASRDMDQNPGQP